MSYVKFAGKSDLGLVRRENEDHFLLDKKQGLYLVADGIGGAMAGGLASRAVAEILPQLIRRNLNGIKTLDDPAAARQVLSALAELSNRLCKASKGQPGISGMGSTVVMALIRDRHALIAHLGDSRAYLLHEKRLEQLTKDHSLLQLLVDCGEVTPEEASKHPARGKLTRFVGMPMATLPEASIIKLAPGDRLLLCSDGLSNSVNHKQLENILNQANEPKEACKQLVNAANDAGGADNITAVVIAI